MPDWMERHLPEVGGRLGVRDLRAPSRDRLYAGLLTVTLVPAVVLAAGARSRPRGPVVYASLAVIGVFFWNALVPHAASAAVLGAYTPGLVSAAFLTIPYGVVVYRRAVGDGYATRGGATLALAAAAVLYPLGMWWLWRPFAGA